MKNLRLITWFMQFGLSVITPLVLCILVAVWLRNRYNTGGWVVVLGIILGIGSAVLGLIDSMKTMERMAREEDREAPVSFNEHK